MIIDIDRWHNQNYYYILLNNVIYTNLLQITSNVFNKSIVKYDTIT